MLKIYYNTRRAVVVDEDTKTYKGMNKSDASTLNSGVQARSYYEENLAQKTSYLKEIGYEERK
ncbi:MAG TPA: hypothetical protein IAA20_03945 [Candidatus Enterococcus avicola]|uniref:Uncharacterized protein n=1 Tax=Candidatus Enterococcus avicola TaxID=2838561 RepID=A0A9D2F6Y6_9ENTE|nr:hypothetical protein [Candidatus Enterococcus avicola]